MKHNFTMYYSPGNDIKGIPLLYRYTFIFCISARFAPQNIDIPVYEKQVFPVQCYMFMKAIYSFSLI